MPTMTFLTTCHFDFGALAMLPKALKGAGVERPFVVTDPGLQANGLLDRLIAALGSEPAATFADTPANPTEEAAHTAAELYRAANCDGIIALGGGSSMDLAKGVAIMVTHPEPFEQYGVTKRGSRLIKTVAPLIAVPTTAGTGSEVSVGAILILDSGRKETFASPKLLPIAAICDPELTLSLPPSLTAATGMDAMTHCVESVLSTIVNPPSEAIGLDGIERVFAKRALERAVADGGDRDARWQMMMASYEGALAFIKGLGVVHGMSHALGRIKELKLHHGTLNAVILPHSLAMIGHAAEEKFARIKRAMGLPASADLVDEIAQLNARIGLPASLSTMGVTPAHWSDETREFAFTDLATGTNAVPFDADKYNELFERAL